MTMGQGLAAAALAALFFAATAHADEITDQIDKALAAYHNKDLRGAAAALDAATALVQQQRTAQWKALLPNALPGWTAQSPEGSVLALSLFGGAVTVSRTYRKGGDIVTVEIIANAPMVQAVAALMSGSLGAMLGVGQLVVIDGRRTLYAKSENSYQMLVGNAALVKVSGSRGTDDAVLRQYLHAVDFAAIERLVS